MYRYSKRPFKTKHDCSDYSGSNTKLSKILLNGNNICMVTSFDKPTTNPI
jgi:hypothetical protein